MPRPTVPLLSRQQVIASALDLIDETGGFTLTKLAGRLGVSSSSIYHHLPGGREEIVEGIRRLIVEAGMPRRALPGEDWRTFAQRWARGYRQTMVAHPRAVTLLTTQTVSDPIVLSTYEALAQVLARAGFPDAAIVHSISVLDCFVLGSALDSAAPVDVWAEDEHRAPTLSRAIASADGGSAQRSHMTFEIGLMALLAGIDGLGRTSDRAGFSEAKAPGQ